MRYTRMYRVVERESQRGGSEGRYFGPVAKHAHDSKVTRSLPITHPAHTTIDALAHRVGELGLSTVLNESIVNPAGVHSAIRREYLFDLTDHQAKHGLA